MPATVVVGLQWGDEGKGKTTDLLADSVSHVVRYQGGDNAGHTVAIGDEVFKLHLVPSGVLHPHITPVIGSGVVVNPRTLLDEMATLEDRGIDTRRVRVSRSAHVVMPYHVELDRAVEARLDSEGIGTTRRGIGPAYADRAWRTGIRMGDLLEPVSLRRKLARILPERNAVLEETFGVRPFDPDRVHADAVAWGERLADRMRTRRSSSRTHWPPGSTCCWRVPRGRCSTWITARIPSSRAAIPSPAGPAPGEVSDLGRSTA